MRTLEQSRPATTETTHIQDIYRQPTMSQLEQRLHVVRQGNIPPLVSERRWADLPSTANITHHNLRLDQGPANSFKPRGAFTAVVRAIEQGQRFITADSRGNHAQGIAYAVRYFADQGYDDIQTKIWMPCDTPQTKIDGVLSFKRSENDSAIEIDLSQPSLASAKMAAQKATESGYISPFNNYDVIAGQSTVAVEALLAHPDAQAMYVPVGGGGLLASTLEVVDTFKKSGFARPDLKVVAVMLEGNDSLLESKSNNWQLAPATSVDTLAEGLAVKQLGEIPFEIIKQFQEHLDLQVVSRYDLGRMQQHLQNRHSDFPNNELSSLIGHTGALLRAEQRNRYEPPETWITLTTGTNISEEKRQLLDTLYTEERRRTNAVLRAMGTSGVNKAVQKSRPRSRKIAFGTNALSGHILR